MGTKYKTFILHVELKIYKNPGILKFGIVWDKIPILLPRLVISIPLMVIICPQMILTILTFFQNDSLIPQIF